MSVRKKCDRHGCKYRDHRCAHSWISELKVDGVRRPPVSVDDYACRRGGPAHVVGKKDAKEWEVKIKLDWKTGGNPAAPPPAVVVVDPTVVTVEAALVGYQAQGIVHLAVQAPVLSEIRHVSGYFGARPLIDLQAEATIFDFINALREGWRPDRHGTPQEPLEDGRGQVAVNRLLHRVRHFLNWQLAQQVPVISRTPFHRRGVVIKISDETQRTRRLAPGEQEALLAACEAIDDAAHYFAGRVVRRRILGALELGARGSELDRVSAAEDIDWARGTVRLRQGKSDPRSLAFDLAGPLAQAIAPRRFLKAERPAVFGDADGVVASVRSAWETVVLLAHGKIRADGRGRSTAEDVEHLAAINLHFHDLRRECATRWYDETGHDLRQVQVWLGHKHIETTKRYLAVPDIDQQAAKMAERLGFAGAKAGAQ